MEPRLIDVIYDSLPADMESQLKIYISSEVISEKKFLELFIKDKKSTEDFAINHNVPDKVHTNIVARRIIQNIKAYKNLTGGYPSQIQESFEEMDLIQSSISKEMYQKVLSYIEQKYITKEEFVKRFIDVKTFYETKKDYYKFSEEIKVALVTNHIISGIKFDRMLQADLEEKAK